MSPGRPTHCLANAFSSAKPKVLLHACCAPCATVPFERLAATYELAVFFYGPNIHPKEEYLARLMDLRKLCHDNNLDLYEGEYRPAEWGRVIAAHRHLPEGSQRCQACYRLRMERTAHLAKEKDFDFFTVTLSVSRHKNSKILETIGRDVGEIVGINYLADDFKKMDGYNQSVRRSRELGMRRQNYCGCGISRNEARHRQTHREISVK